MATCTISGTLLDPSETGISGATIRVNVVAPLFNAANSLIAPKEITTTSNASGVWSIAVSQGASIVLSIDYPPNSTDSTRRYNYSISVPNTGSANFSTLATEL